MKLRNLLICFSSSVDSAVAKIQNHEALSEAALRDLRQSISLSSIRVAELDRAIKNTDAELKKAKEEESKWKTRAVEAGRRDDKDEAIECLRRAKLAASRVATLQTQLATSSTAAASVRAKLSELKNLDHKLTLKHTELRARNKVSLSTGLNNSAFLDPQEILNRWEDTIPESTTEPLSSIDPFEEAYQVAEEKADLELQLSELLQK